MKCMKKQQITMFMNLYFLMKYKRMQKKNLNKDFSAKFLVPDSNLTSLIIIQRASKKSSTLMNRPTRFGIGMITLRANSMSVSRMNSNTTGLSSASAVKAPETLK